MAKCMKSFIFGIATLKKKSGTILCSLILYGQGGFFNGKNIFKY